MADSGEELVRMSHRDLVNLAKLRASGEMSREESNCAAKPHKEKSKKSDRPIYMPGQKRFNRRKTDEAGDILPTKSAVPLEIPVTTIAACGSSPDESSCAPMTSVNINNQLQLEKCGNSTYVSLKGYSAQRKSTVHDKNCRLLTSSEAVCRPKSKNSDCTDDAERQQIPVLQSVCKFSSDQSLNSSPKVLDYNTDSVANKQSGDTRKHQKFAQETLKSDERWERKRDKKPDIQLYVPKGRQQMLLTKDSGPIPLLPGKPSDVSCASDSMPAVSNVVVNDVNQPCTQLVAESAERRVTTKHESMVEITISQQENADDCRNEVKKVGGAVRKRRQRKSKGRTGEFPSQLDSRISRKVVHDGRNSWQKHQHKWHASGARNGTNDDISEVEELEWDHQADLDLGQSEIKLPVATQKQDTETDAAKQGGAELQHIGSLAKPTGEKRNRKVRKKPKEGKRVSSAESRLTHEDDRCLSADKATKPRSGNFWSEDFDTNAPAELTSKDDNFEGKFDLLVITNSRKLHSPSVEGITHQYGPKHKSDDSHPLHVDDGVVNEDDNNSTQLTKTENPKMQVLKKNDRDIRSFGSKYDSPKKTGAYKTRGVTCEEELNGRISVDSKVKADKTNVQELSSENPAISDKNVSARVGGIIRLPAGTSTSALPKPNHASSSNRHAQQHGIKDHARSRVATRRTLYDPNHPMKGAEPSPYFNELPDSSEHFTNESYASREYDHNVQAQKLQHPFYNSLASFGQSLPVDNYSYHYPVPPCFDGCSYDGGSLMNDLYFQGYDLNGQPLPSSELTTLVREATMFDNQLTVCLSQGINSEEALKRMGILRKEILTRYEQVILLDLDFCNQQNIGDALWRSAFYQVIEVFRKQIKEYDSEAKNLLMTILDESLEFFEKLLQKVQVKYNFSVDKHLDAGEAIHESVRRTVKLGLVACQRMMMCLGDLARYKELVNQSSNFGRARSWYMKAQQIAPKNGKPYNQLAVLALYTRRKLDAVYYYMRSLAATNPLLTARENLMSLFDEARRKMEHTDRNRQLEKAQRKRMKAKRCPSEQPHRLEIWILPDGSSSQDQIRDDENDSDDLLGLSVVELNKRFVLSYLHVHGKLFTKIGMETFPESVGRMLQEFQILIHHSPSPNGWMRLLQLMTINMFAIENTIRKETNSLDGCCRSVMQEQAMQLGFEMFGLLIEQCIHLLQDYRESYGNKVTITFGADLQQIFPSVKAWSDWMICHSNLWNPPPIPFDPLLGPNVDVWRLMADLFNVISELDTCAVVLNEKKIDGCKAVLLCEDVMLAGFIPLLSITRSPVYILSDVDKDLAQDCLRIDKLRTFAEFVYGLDPAILSYSAETRRYTSIVASYDEEEEATKKRNVKDLASSEELTDEQENGSIIIEDEVSIELYPSATSEDDGQEHHISQLKARKQELTRKFAEEKKKQENLEAAIESSHQDFRRIELEIHPVFLVLDTNCLIDHLRSIQKLLAAKKYTFIMPLVVINELDGLAKNLKESCYDTIEQAEMVRAAAEMAVQFLETEFDRRNHHLRAITSKGSTLDTIAFRSEEPQDAGTNDDLILSCCLRHCQDKARDFMPKSLDEPIRLYRDVVLLTNDRNLRLKAHLHNVPVKDIPSFMKWANIS